MSSPPQTFRIPALRTIPDFIGDNRQWVIPKFNPNELHELQKQILSNLIYYQTNYAAIAIPLLLLVAFFRPTAILFGLIVVGILVAGFVYSTRQHTQLTTILHDRPIVILILVLVIAFMIIRMFGTIFAFLFGIALPLILIIVHATIRKPTLQNRVANTIENLSLQETPMGILLTLLGAKQAEDKSATTSTTKHK